MDQTLAELQPHKKRFYLTEHGGDGKLSIFQGALGQKGECGSPGLPVRPEPRPDRGFLRVEDFPCFVLVPVMI